MPSARQFLTFWPLSRTDNGQSGVLLIEMFGRDAKNCVSNKTLSMRIDSIHAFFKENSNLARNTTKPHLLYSTAVLLSYALVLSRLFETFGEAQVAGL